MCATQQITGPDLTLEGLQFTKVRVNYVKARQLEQFIAKNNNKDKLPLEYYYISSYGTYTPSDRLEIMFDALFKSYGLIVFYMMLTILSVVYIIVFAGK